MLSRIPHSRAVYNTREAGERFTRHVFECSRTRSASLELFQSSEQRIMSAVAARGARRPFPTGARDTYGPGSGETYEWPLYGAVRNAA